MLLHGATLAGGDQADVRLAGGVITDIAASLIAREAEAVLDLRGYLLLPAPAEPHAHLDKALTADRVENPAHDLPGAIAAWTAFRATLSVDDMVERATRAALLLLANGATAIRTHVDVAPNIGLRAVEALATVREALAGRLDLQVVALVAPPVGGPEGAEQRARLRDAMDAGADVVGGCPHIDPDPLGCLEACFQVAVDTGRPIDLHTDETLDPHRLDLHDFAALVRHSGFDRGATASHCVSLGMLSPADQAAIAAEVAAAGVAVVTLPQTNLFLQGRDRPTGTPPRPHRVLRPLLAAGVTVAAGGDNLQDPFNLMGRGDPLEAASLLVAAGHLQPAEAYHAVSAACRRRDGPAGGGDRAGRARRAAGRPGLDRARGGGVRGRPTASCSTTARSCPAASSALSARQADAGVDELVGGDVRRLQRLVHVDSLLLEDRRDRVDDLLQLGVVEVAERLVGAVAHDAVVERRLDRVGGQISAVRPARVLLLHHLDDEVLCCLRVGLHRDLGGLEDGHEPLQAVRVLGQRLRLHVERLGVVVVAGVRDELELERLAPLRDLVLVLEGLSGGEALLGDLAARRDRTRRACRRRNRRPATPTARRRPSGTPCTWRS